MDADEIRSYRQSLILEVISSAAFLLTVALLAYATDECRRDLLRARLRRLVHPEEPVSPADTEVRRFMAEVTAWEHAQRGEHGR